MRIYIAFCQHHDLRRIDPDVSTLCAYIEHLARRLKNPKSVTNYFSAVRLLHKFAGVTAHNIDHFKVELMLRALPLTMRHRPHQRAPITIAMLKVISAECDKLGHTGVVLKAAYLLAFFGFLRQSNLCPGSRRSFDATRHTCRADVAHKAPGLVITLKWTKTMQRADSAHCVAIPAIPGSPIDPVAAYDAMLALVPTQLPTDPLLSFPRGRMVTCKMLSRALGSILTQSGYTAGDYSLHSLRRGGASASFHANCDQTEVRRHGSWAPSSTAFWEYITRESVADSVVANALAQAATATD